MGRCKRMGCSQGAVRSKGVSVCPTHPRTCLNGHWFGVNVSALPGRRHVGRWLGSNEADEGLEMSSPGSDPGSAPG